MSLEDRVNSALAGVRPYLVADGGDVVLEEIVESKIVKVRFLGECSSCPMQYSTFKAGIEETIKKMLPEIETVIAINENE